MLALSTRRQHLPQPHYSSPSAQQLSYHQLPQQLASQQFFDEKLLHDYLESQQSFAAPASSAPDSLMTSAFDFVNPAIRIQQSTPQPQLHQSAFSQAPMLSTNATSTALDSWNVYATAQPMQAPVESVSSVHQRAASSSSVGSSASQFQQVGPSTSYPYVAENLPSALDSLYVADASTRSFPNQMPTPTQTPTQESYMNTNNFNNYPPTSATMDMAAHMSMKQALMDQGDDVPDFAHSGRQSVSSYGHDSPATPHTHSDDLDFKLPANGEILRKVDSWLFNQFCTYEDEADIRQPTMPKFERTYTDLAADTFYDPSAVAAQSIPQSKPAQSSMLSPYRHNANENVQRALQAAQYARSQSPSSSARGDSPFRRSSPWRQTASNYSSPLVGTAVAARERQTDTSYAMKSQMRSTEEAQPKTVSPKDIGLVYPETDDDSSKMPLFPDGSTSEYDGSYHGPDQYSTATQSSFDAAPAQSYRRDSWATPQFPPTFSTSVASSLPQNAKFDFTSAPMQGDMHGLPLTSTPQYRSTPSRMTSVLEQTPEFPAHLTSMESSASEAEPPSGSQNSEVFLRKPASSNADTGTYSCTYHGCSQRFETPQKLQKHKREGHRNASVGATMTSAAILERNSQAGPHKCDRINPTTGKPCSTVFSRPYDLTRHEDTIHNARKQKVRCALCVEEKTFSRNDALTRHMVRVHHHRAATRRTLANTVAARRAS